MNILDDGRPRRWPSSEWFRAPSEIPRKSDEVDQKFRSDSRAVHGLNFHLFYSVVGGSKLLINDIRGFTGSQKRNNF